MGEQYGTLKTFTLPLISVKWLNHARQDRMLIQISDSKSICTNPARRNLYVIISMTKDTLGQKLSEIRKEAWYTTTKGVFDEGSDLRRWMDRLDWNRENMIVRLSAEPTQWRHRVPHAAPSRRSSLGPARF